MKWQTEFYILGVARWLYSPSLSPAEQAVLPSKQPCAQLSLRRAQRKVYLANELAVVRETLPAPGGQREILHGDLEGIFSVSQRGWTMTSLGHSPIRRITRCDAEIARVRTRFRRFVLRVYECVAFMRNKLRLGHQRC